MTLTAHLSVGKKSHWQQIYQGGIVVADVWGKLRKYEWVSCINLAMVVIGDDSSIIGFFWVNEVIIDYPENRIETNGS